MSRAPSLLLPLLAVPPAATGGRRKPAAAAGPQPASVGSRRSRRKRAAAADAEDSGGEQLEQLQQLPAAPQLLDDAQKAALVASVKYHVEAKHNPYAPLVLRDMQEKYPGLQLTFARVRRNLGVVSQGW